MTITVNDMRNKLLSLDELRDRLAPHEKMSIEAFTVGENIRFEADPAWYHAASVKSPDDPIGVFANIRRGPDSHARILLTRSTLNEVCGMFGFTKSYVHDCPPDLLVPHMNYWYRAGLMNRSRKAADYQFVVNPELHAVAFTKQASTPFSNVHLLDVAVEGIHGLFGDVEVLADYKLTNTLRATTMRLVVPGVERLITGTGTEQDVWSLGVQVKNSLTGQSQTSVEGYLFRWVCTNGQIDATASSGAWTRRKDSTVDEAYGWARQAVDDALRGLEGSFDALQRLTDVGIDGSLADTLRDIFEHYRIALPLRPRIIRYLEEYPGEITMYVIMNAITQAANDPELDPSAVDGLMRVGGDFARSAEQRCGACHRLMAHAH
jgi:hypothetical protein